MSKLIPPVSNLEASQLMATVLSEPGPQKGQKFRSSGDFSVINPPAGTKYLVFFVFDASDDDEDTSGKITFWVNRDLRGKDKGVFNDAVHDGYYTTYTDLQNCYIGGPSGATGNFRVDIYATDTRPE